MRSITTFFCYIILAMLVLTGCSLLGERFNVNDPYSTAFDGKPSGLSASDGTFADKVALRWKDLASADTYYIYRRDTSSDDFEKIGESKTASFDDTDSNLVYYFGYEYMVKARMISNIMSGSSNIDSGFVYALTRSAPHITGLTDGLYNDSQVFTIGGYYGALIEYSLDNGTTWNTYTGQVDLTADGTYLITARQTDILDNQSGNTPVFEITIDTTLSDITALPAPVISGISSGLYNGALLMTVTGLAYTDIEYSLNNGAAWNAYTGDLTIDTDGTYEIIVRQKDRYGHTSAETELITVVIDTGLPGDLSLPRPVISGVVNGLYNTARSFTVTGLDYADIEYSLDGGTTWILYTGNVTLDTNGAYDIIARQSDDFGHTSPDSTLISVAIDTTLTDTTSIPAPVVTGITDGSFNTTQTLSIAGLDYTLIEYSVDNGSTWITYTASVNLSVDGTYTVIARQSDDFSHVSDSTTAITVTIDTVAPTAVLTGAPDAVTIDTVLAVTVGGSGVTAYKYRLDGAAWSGENLIAVEITDSLSETAHTLDVIARDAAGNWQAEGSPTSVAFTVDVSAPADATGAGTTVSSSVEIDLSWTNPVTDFSGALVVRETGTAVTFTPIDGRGYLPAQNVGGTQVVVRAANMSGVTATGLEPDTHYYFKIYTYDSVYNYSGGVSVDATTEPAVIYVDVSTGADSNDGLTELTPMKTIQAGIDEADSLFTSAEVHVKAGSYNENLLMKDGISLYGGYNSSDWNDRDNVDRTNMTYKTVISSASQYTVSADFLDTLSAGTVIDGFVIYGGSVGSASAAIRFTNASVLTISNNTVYGGNAANSYGIFSMGPTFTITDNIIYAEDGSSNSIGVYIYQGDATITGNVINGGTTGNSTGINVSYASPHIEDNTVDGGAGTLSFGINVDSESAPTITGNRITAGNSSQASGIYANGSKPTITDNTIDGGTGSTFSYGIYIYSDSDCDIFDNTITGGTGGSSYGIYAYSNTTATTRIHRNKIHGGTGTSESAGICIDSSLVEVINNVISGGVCTAAYSYGIYNSSSSPDILHNTIDGGTSTYAYAVYLYDTTVPAIKNNILFVTSGSTEAYGIYEYYTSGDPSSLLNNNIFDCTAYYDADGAGDLTSDTDLNDYTKITQDALKPAAGNITIDMIDNGGQYYFTDYNGTDNDINTIDDNDLSITAAAPVNIRAGGIDITTDVTDDITGTARTTSYNTGAGTPTNTDAGGVSMGAYEKD